jgi:flavin reductase (DIM6/NTAB) family NADH-FMN oxidoreductase RutF
MNPASSPTQEFEMQAIQDPRQLRNCFGQFTTGVTVVTYELDGEWRGATVNSFTSVSLDPPLVLVSIAKSAKASAALEGRSFSVNVLAKEQHEVALQFAGKPREGIDVGWIEGEIAPRLAGALAWFECKPWCQYDGGDHILFVGEVAQYAARPAEPLVFYAGSFRSVAMAA